MGFIVLGIAASLIWYWNGVPLGRSIVGGIALAILTPLLLLLSPMLAIAVWIGVGVVGGRILAQRGYPPLLGVMAGMVLGPLGLIGALVMPRTRAGEARAAEENRIASERDAGQHLHPCPECGRNNAATSRFCPRCNYRYA